MQYAWYIHTIYLFDCTGLLQIVTDCLLQAVAENKTQSHYLLVHGSKKNHYIIIQSSST